LDPIVECVNNYNRAFSDWFPLSYTKLAKKMGVIAWKCLHVLKQICKQIGSKLTVFYSNDYHFTKIMTLLCKFYLKMSKFKPDLRSDIIYISIRYPKTTVLLLSTIVQGLTPTTISHTVQWKLSLFVCSCRNFSLKQTAINFCYFNQYLCL
jgi:hypothetical protein